MNDADYNIFERYGYNRDDITWEPIESKITHDKIVSTTIIFKKSTFGGVEVKTVKNIFGHLNVGMTETNLQPQIVNGESTIDVDTFGSVKGYVITNVIMITLIVRPLQHIILAYKLILYRPR